MSANELYDPLAAATNEKEESGQESSNEGDPNSPFIEAKREVKTNSQESHKNGSSAIKKAEEDEEDQDQENHSEDNQNHEEGDNEDDPELENENGEEKKEHNRRKILKKRRNEGEEPTEDADFEPGSENKKRKKKKLKKRRSEGAEDVGEIFNEEEEPVEEEPRRKKKKVRVIEGPSEVSESSIFVKGLIGKQGKKGGRRKEIYDFEILENKVDRLMTTMENAIEADVEKNKKGVPTFEKLLATEKVVSELKKTQFQEIFLQKEGCKLLAGWVSKLPDGTYPTINTLIEILELMNLLPITTENLQKSSLGRVVREIYEKIEDIKIKKLAKGLIDKWCRSIFKVEVDFSQLGDNESAYKKYQSKFDKYKKKQSDDSEGPLIKEFDRNNISTTEKHARIPESGVYDFKIRPQSSAEPKITKIDPESTYGRLSKTLHNIKRKRNQWAAGVRKL